MHFVEHIELNGWHFTKIFYVFFWVSLKFVTRGPTANRSLLVQVMTWRRTGAKTLPESMMTHFTDINESLGLLLLTVISQDFTWTNDDPVPCSHMEFGGHNELIHRFYKSECHITRFPTCIVWLLWKRRWCTLPSGSRRATVTVSTAPASGSVGKLIRCKQFIYIYIYTCI